MPRRHPSTDRASAVSPPGAARSDITINDAFHRRLRGCPQVSVPVVCGGAHRVPGGTHRAAGWL